MIAYVWRTILEEFRHLVSQREHGFFHSVSQKEKLYRILISAYSVMINHRKVKISVNLNPVF